MDKPTAGLRKRQQISRANRTMLLWIAGVSVIVGVSIVLVVFLAQKIWFGEKVLAEKNHTVSVLKDDLSAIEGEDGLRNNIQQRNTDENLIAVRLNENDPPLQSILDALPGDANSTALASSLQIKLLSGIPGVVIETINVDPTGDAESSTGTDQIGFTFSVSADASNYPALKQVIERLEKSIRPFNVTSLGLEGQGSKVIMTVAGASYYSQAKTVELQTKVVRQ
jgi:hypothetical protein